MQRNSGSPRRFAARDDDREKLAGVPRFSVLSTHRHPPLAG